MSRNRRDRLAQSAPIDGGADTQPQRGMALRTDGERILGANKELNAALLLGERVKISLPTRPAAPV